MITLLKMLLKHWRAAAVGLLVLVVLLLAWWVNDLMNTRAIRETVVVESAATRDRVDARASELAAKLDALQATATALAEKVDATDRKLDRIDEKLDRLIEFTIRPLADGLRRAE